MLSYFPELLKGLNTSLMRTVASLLLALIWPGVTVIRR